MNIAVPQEFVPYVDQLVAAGTFPTAEAVIGDALAQMRDRRLRLDDLKASFDEAAAELTRGERHVLDFEEIKRKGRERLAMYRSQS